MKCEGDFVAKDSKDQFLIDGVEEVLEYPVELILVLDWEPSMHTMRLRLKYLAWPY